MSTATGPARARNWHSIADTARRHPSAATFLFLLAVAALARPAAYGTPLERDSGQYLYVGRAILDGGAPYVDAANNKGPVTYLVFALIDLVGQGSALVVHIATVLAVAAAAYALMRYVEHFAGRGAGLLAGAILAVFLAATDIRGLQPNTEQFALAGSVGAWWLATRTDRSSRAGAGALIAAAVLINPSFGWVAGFVAFELWRGSADHRRRAFTEAAAGALAVLIPVALWLLAAGALDDMLVQVGDTSLRSVAGTAGRAPERMDLPFSTFWVLGVAAGVIALRKPRLRRVAVPALLWTAVAWARYELGAYQFDHYVLPAFAGLAAALAVGIASVWRDSLLGRVALAVVVLAVPAWIGVLRPQANSLRDRPLAQQGDPSSAWTLAYPAARFVRANTPPDARIFVAASVPNVYVLAVRTAPTRFFDSFPLQGRPDYAREQRTALERHPPAAIVTFASELSEPWIAPFTRSHPYRLAYSSGGARVWLLD